MSVELEETECQFRCCIPLSCPACYNDKLKLLSALVKIALEQHRREALSRIQRNSEEENG